MSETIEKLVKLARGDLDLLQFAIRRAVVQVGGSADLKRVVQIIVSRLPSPPEGKG